MSLPWGKDTKYGDSQICKWGKRHRAGTTIREEEIKGIESVLALVGGKVVYGAGEFGSLAPPLLPVSPDWSPSGTYGGYRRATADSTKTHKGCACQNHRQVWLPKESRFWGIGCDCFAF